MILAILSKIFKKAFAQGFGRDTGGGIEIENPLGAENISVIINNVINGLLLIAGPIVTIMVLYGAFQILTAAGDPEKFKTGKKTILYAAIGLGIILIAKGVEFIIRELLGVEKYGPGF